MTDFFPIDYITSSKKRRFGVCDPPASEERAYIAEKKGESWIAVVDNYYEIEVKFVPVDHCIDLWKPDGKFVELKDRNSKGADWIKDAELQLRSTIKHFEEEQQSELFCIKKAYIANCAKPRFRSGQAIRMENFFIDTKYVLRIENSIEIV